MDRVRLRLCGHQGPEYDAQSPPATAGLSGVRPREANNKEPLSESLLCVARHKGFRGYYFIILRGR